MVAALTPRDLEVVRRVAATGSLTTTAKQMHVSQPAISQRLATLQDRLGTELFVRREGRMQATPAAERLAEAAIAVDRVLAQAMDDVRSLLDERARRFRITTQCHTSYRWLSFVIRDLVKSRPALAVDVVPEAIEDPYGAVERDEVDVALVYLPNESSPLDGIELFTDEMYAVMRADHRLSERKMLNPDDFEGEALVGYAGRGNAFVDLVLTPAGVTPGRLRQVRMTEAIVELARAGQGIAVLAGWVINDLVSRQDLVAVRIGRGGWHRTWRAIVGAQCPPELAQAFVASVKRTARGIGKDRWREKLEARSA